MALSTGCWFHIHINYNRLLIQQPPLQQSQPRTPPDQTPTPADQTIYQTPPSHPPATSPPAQQCTRGCRPPVVTAPIPAPNFNRDVPPPTNTERTPPSGLVQQRRSRWLNPRYYNEDNRIMSSSCRVAVDWEWHSFLMLPVATPLPIRKPWSLIVPRIGSMHASMKWMH